MELSPRLYHWIVRPKYTTDLYINNVLRSHFKFTDKTVLDFGCGIGSSSWLFPPANYLGVDLDSKRIAYAKHLYPEYNFKVFKGNSLPVASRSLDYIVIIAVLHHIAPDEIQFYLQEFRRLLKPYGKIIVIEPCLFENSRFNNRFMKFLDNGKHIRTEKGYLDFFKGNRFKVRVIQKYRRLFYNEILFIATV